MLPDMRARSSIAIVGAGSLAAAVAVSLRRMGYEIETVITRPRAASLRKARSLAREVGARVGSSPPLSLHAEVVWFCVPDAEIARTARALRDKVEWKGKVALHSSGALTSDELAALHERGA